MQKRNFNVKTAEKEGKEIIQIHKTKQNTERTDNMNKHLKRLHRRKINNKME